MAEGFMKDKMTDIKFASQYATTLSRGWREGIGRGGVFL